MVTIKVKNYFFITKILIFRLKIKLGNDDSLIIEGNDSLNKEENERWNIDEISDIYELTVLFILFNFIFLQNSFKRVLFHIFMIHLEKLQNILIWLHRLKVII